MVVRLPNHALFRPTDLVLVRRSRTTNLAFAAVRTVHPALGPVPCLTQTSSEGEVSKKIDKLADAVKQGFDEQKIGLSKGAGDMKEVLDKVAKSVQESVMCINNLQAANCPYPHLVVVEETKAQGTKGLASKIRCMAAKDMTLHFLCPVDMSKVPCGVRGEGYRLRQTRSWVKKMSPVLQVRQICIMTGAANLFIGSGLVS